MKRTIVFLLSVLIILSFSSCSSSSNEQPTNLPTYEPLTEENATQYDENSNISNDSNGESTTKNQTTTTTAPVLKPTEASSSVVTYYSESPNNRYIRAVSERYGVDSSCLVALIKTNSKTPGATVLQFTGEKDSSGKVIKNENTLKYVYDVPDYGVIKKASGQKTDYEGYNYVENYVNYNLAVEFIIPELENTKRERTYEDYFAN